MVLTQPRKTSAPPKGVGRSLVKWRTYEPKYQAFMVELASTQKPWYTKFVSPDHGIPDVYHVTAEFEKPMYNANFNDCPRNLKDGEVTAELKQAYRLTGTGAKILDTTDIKMVGCRPIEVISKTGPIYIVGRFSV